MKLPHVVIVWSLSSVAMAETTYFVDSEGGDDAANGQSERTAWKTLGRINRGEVGPGDTVLLAGKGHETYQILSTGKIDYDERVIVKELSEALGC